MTLIETRLIGNVIKRGLTALSEAWASLRKLDFNITATESNPQLVQIVPPNEVVVVIGFELKLSNRAGTMNLCIPYNVIEPVMAQLSNQSWFSTGKSQRTKEVQDNLQNSLGRAPVEVQGILATTTITLRDLLQLSPGDLITTERGATQPVMVNIEGERKFLAQIGQFKGQRALRITRAASPHDRD
jgi:flagellar motor switch protein FliM